MKVTWYVKEENVNWSLHRDWDRKWALWWGFSIKVWFVYATLYLPITWLTWCRNLDLIRDSFDMYSEWICLNFKVKVVMNLARVVGNFKSKLQRVVLIEEMSKYLQSTRTLLPFGWGVQDFKQLALCKLIWHLCCSSKHIHFRPIIFCAFLLLIIKTKAWILDLGLRLSRSHYKQVIHI